jgi:hypothetical protein
MATSLQVVRKEKPRKIPELGTGKRTIASIKREIAQLEKTRERANRDYFKASKAIQEKGVSAVRTQTDKRGYSFRAIRVSINVRILEASGKVVRNCDKMLDRLREELQRLEAPKEEKDSTDSFFDEQESGDAAD